MNIIKPIDTTQELIFIPRKTNLNVVFTLIDELTENETVTENEVFTSGLYSVIEVSGNFSEGDSYSYQIDDLDGNLMYRGKIFVTDSSDIQNYNINKDYLTA